MRSTILLCFMLYSVTLLGQANSPKDSEGKWIVNEQQAEYPGGWVTFYQFVYNNLECPVSEKDTKLLGTVIVSFTIDKTGELTNARVVKGVSADWNKEVLRVLELSPKWQPASNRAIPTSEEMEIPIKIKCKEGKD